MSTTPEPAPGAIPGREWLLVNGRHVMLERLDRREPVITLGVRAARTVDIAKTAQLTGHHLVWIELEHSTMSIDTEKDAARVETPEEAADIAAACRFPALGRRSQIVGLPLFGMRRLPPRQHNDLANRATIVKVLIETERGLRNVEKIAAVPGVDLIGIGSNDFIAELGILGDYRHEKVRAAYRVGIEGCKKHGKHFIIGGVADLEYQRELWDAGAGLMIQSAIDSELMKDRKFLRVRAAKCLRLRRVSGSVVLLVTLVRACGAKR